METIEWVQISPLQTGAFAAQTTTQHEHNGISWTWSISLSDASKSDFKKNVYFEWRFSWDELMKQGIDGFEGTITVSYCYFNPYRNSYIPGFPRNFNVQVTRSGQCIEKLIGKEEAVNQLFTGGDFYFQCFFRMTPIKNSYKLDFFNKSFAASDKTNAILVVEGKKLHVNKQFLSFHSEYFNTLFNSNFKEKSMKEIPIEGVKYADFARLLCAVYPNPILPTIYTYETLLELADRFMMPQVTHLVELVLIGSESLRISEKISLADKYSMNELLEACLKSFETVTDMKRISERNQLDELSDATKAKLFHKTLTLL